MSTPIFHFELADEVVKTDFGLNSRCLKEKNQTDVIQNASWDWNRIYLLLCNAVQSSLPITPKNFKICKFDLSRTSMHESFLKKKKHTTTELKTLPESRKQGRFERFLMLHTLLTKFQKIHLNFTWTTA